ncbi:copper chaperone [Cymbomonas tetramitiformis]|uniref:Copper chaperone n=1 Tax=Cymbomonas tetramitiformis TaxID=36881 RepID=A0AAE0FYI0_9CHLO|nr:copper chaperone [Cymbomonas tetramitiformis]
MYQTDWSLAALKLRAQGQQLELGGVKDETFSLPMAALGADSGVSGRIWGTFLPIGTPDPARPRGLSILARDLQSVVIYDEAGEFVGVRRPGSKKPLDVGGVELVIEDVIGASGLQIKMDPGVPFVYAGFGGLIVTTFISYLSHSQVWALQNGDVLYVGGRTNRATLDFERELSDILDKM